MDINLFNLRKMFQPDQMVGQNTSIDVVPINQPNQMMNYEPEHQATDQFNSLLSQYPTRSNPSVMRKIGAALLNLGGQDGMSFLDEPNTRRIEDWKNKINPTLNAANLERNNNINERQINQFNLNNKLASDKATIAASQGQQKIDIAAARNKALTDAQAFKEKNPDWQIKQVEGKWTFFNPKDPNAKPVNTGLGDLSETEKANLNHENRTAEIAQQGQNQLTNTSAAAETRGWSLGTIPDPKDPTKQIGVQINQISGEVKPITFNGQTTPISKPGTDKADDVTNQTKTMMEGATMLRPHVADLRKQAADLDRRGLFGPVMSRIRNLAAKVGTTGSPEEIQKNLENLSNTISSDPLLNQSNDAAVGQFLTNLGLLTSGVGRVHGGARGGGSIQMINYLKSLLSSESTLSMFNGRLGSVDDYLKTYAAGPKGTSKTRLDLAIEKALGGQ